MGWHRRVNGYVAYVNMRSTLTSSRRCKTTHKSLLTVMVVLRRRFKLRMPPMNDIIPRYVTFSQQQQSTNPQDGKSKHTIQGNHNQSTDIRRYLQNLYHVPHCAEPINTHEITFEHTRTMQVKASASKNAFSKTEETHHPCRARRKCSKASRVSSRQQHSDRKKRAAQLATQ
jgi:hypothetical protein